MAEIEITLPTVQYGNVKLRLSEQEAGISFADPDVLGDWAAVYINLFTQGFKKGSARDVGAPVSASQEAPEEKAKELLNEGLGGVTEVSEGPLNMHPNDGPEESDDAPWKQKVDAKKKPWEAGETAPKAVTEDW